ncbi:type VII secretion protein EssC [Enterococcus sp. AZ135]|uniref:type VII secretion protein EssC n=1 Tax=unclassified Enterococcus TaxID=2608891 RepID=UPI003F21D20F
MMSKLNNRPCPSIDDQIVEKEAVLFDVFLFEDVFDHIELSEGQTVLFHGTVINCVNGELFIENSVEPEKEFLVLPHAELSVFMTTLPKEKWTISKAWGSEICVASEAIGVLSIKEDRKELNLIVEANGEQVYWNDQRVAQLTTEFAVGDRVIISGVMIERREKQFKITCLKQNVKLDFRKVMPEAVKNEFPVSFPDFRRSPRIHLKPPKTEQTVTPPSAKTAEGKSEILRSIVPPLGMIVLSGASSVLSGGNPIMMLSMGGASLLTAGFSVSSYFTNKKETKRKNELRDETYQRYMIQQKKELEQLSAEQREALEYQNPALETLSQMTKEYHPRIYERTAMNADFLQFRLGTGEIPTSFKVDFRKNENEADPLADFAEEKVVWPHQMLKDAPITTTLLDQTIGLAGMPDNLRNAVQTILFQISVFHSYRDVQFIALLNEEDYAEKWHDWRWLPHFQLQQLNLRGMIHNAQSRDMGLNSFYQLISKRRQQLKESEKNEKIQFSPHYVLTILDESWLSGHGLNEYLAEDMSQYGVTVIWGKETANMLPETTTTMIEYQSSEAATLVNENHVYVNQLFRPVHLPKEFTVTEAIQRLANLNHVEVEKNAIPEAIDFLGMYEVKRTEELQIAQRWQKANTSKSLAVPLGLRGKDDVVSLNLHERAHGPHGLVAGTTGSGKSEIVQSYILSLAVNFAPEDVGFLPIDFKGGGMANLFAKLPHLLGSITNLDGASSARALQSIRAELQKRQRKFGEFGVNHINGYTKLYKQGKEITDPIEKKKYPSDPLPHLFLISDEFAELKANEPDFMAELVSTARIGRSLGVHLILATQKPSGVVDDQIWSNSRFKLALKVADPADSNEIIKTPDAASITQPGRAYLQVGNNEIYELFQSAWSGATYDPNATHEEKIDERIWWINNLGQYELLTMDLSEDEVAVVKTEEEQTQLDAVVEAIAKYADHSRAVLPDKPWLPPLEEVLDTPVIALAEWKKERRLAVPLGLMDIPTRQEQVNFDFDLESFSHTAVYGSPGFGKSTLLQTLLMNLARQNNPEQVQFNLFDFGTNGLLPLKELPHVVDHVRLEEEEKLLKFLKRIRTEIQRRKDAFTAYGVASLSQYEKKAGVSLPVIITVVDGFDAIKECPLEEPIESVLNQLLREGASLGLYAVMAVLRTNSFKMSMSSNIPSHIGLFLVEDGAIRDVVGRDALIPQEIIGRAQIKLEMPQEVQIYLPAKGENDIDRLNHLEAEIVEIDHAWKGERPTKIPMLSNVISWEEFYGNKDTQYMLDQLQLPIALDKETTAVIGFDPREHGYFVIGDDTPQQTESIERVIMENFKRLDGQAQRVIFNSGDRFETYSESADMLVSEGEYSTFSNDLISEISEREASGIHEPMFVYIPDVQAFSDKSFITSENFNRYLKKGPKVGIYFILQGNQKQIENSFDDVNKTLRANIPAGMAGTRLVDQSFVNVKSSYNEPTVELDESHFFVGRNACRVKLVSE